MTAPEQNGQSLDSYCCIYKNILLLYSTFIKLSFLKAIWHATVAIYMSHMDYYYINIKIPVNLTPFARDVIYTFFAPSWLKNNWRVRKVFL